MTDAPPVPPDADLRRLPGMMLDVARLRDSGLAAVDDAEVFRANVLAWCVAWHQVPAGSLPSDDVELMRLLGYGRDKRAWNRVSRGGGLRGWMKHLDGRLYHPVVTETVLAALKTKEKHRVRAKTASAKRWKHDATSNATSMPVAMLKPCYKHANITEHKGKEEKVSASSLRSDDAVPASVHPVTLPRNVRDELWQAGLPIIRELTGLPEAKARAMLGRMLKAAGDDCAKVLRAIREAADTRPVDPAAWLMAACKPQTGNPFLAVARDAAAQRAPPLLIEGLAAIEKLGGSKG